MPFLIFLFLLLLIPPTIASNLHVITLTTQKLHPLCLAWDPSSQHFLVGSHLLPSISSVSDAGVIETLISDPQIPSTSSVSSLTIDNSRRRIIAVFSSPSLIAAYDLRSPRPHRRIFASPLPSPSSGLTVDPTTGTAYATRSGENKIWTVDLEGRVSDLYVSAVKGGGLGGVAHVSRGFLLAVEERTGRVWKVRPEEEEGAAKEVLLNSRYPAVVVAVRSDGTAVVAGNKTVRVLKSDDGWMEAVVIDEITVENGIVRGVAVREGKTVYLLVGPDEEVGDSWRIEEIEWESGKEGDLIWGLVLLGLGFAYFLYWRFQMGQLVTNINKKRT